MFLDTIGKRVNFFLVLHKTFFFSPFSLSDCSNNPDSGQLLDAQEPKLHLRNEGDRRGGEWGGWIRFNLRMALIGETWVSTVGQSKEKKLDHTAQSSSYEI